MDPLTAGLIRLAAMGVGKILDSTESRNNYDDPVGHTKSPEEKTAEKALADRLEWDGIYDEDHISVCITQNILIVFVVVSILLFWTLFIANNNIPVSRLYKLSLLLLPIISFSPRILISVDKYIQIRKEYKRITLTNINSETKRRLTVITKSLKRIRARTYLNILQPIALILCMLSYRDYSIPILVSVILLGQLSVMVLTIMTSSMRIFSTK